LGGDFGVEGEDALAEGGEEEVTFGVEVEVDGAFGDAGVGGDLVDGGGVVAAEGEDVAGGFEDFGGAELLEDVLFGLAGDSH
jgi:hypothetical protein